MNRSQLKALFSFGVLTTLSSNAMITFCHIFSEGKISVVTIVNDASSYTMCCSRIQFYLWLGPICLFFSPVELVESNFLMFLKLDNGEQCWNCWSFSFEFKKMCHLEEKHYSSTSIYHWFIWPKFSCIKSIYA